MPTLLDPIRKFLDERRELRQGTTHWPGCYAHHIDCAARALLTLVEEVGQERAGYREALEHIARRDWIERFLSDDDEWNEGVWEFGNYPRGVALAALRVPDPDDAVFSD